MTMGLVRLSACLSLALAAGAGPTTAAGPEPQPPAPLPSQVPATAQGGTPTNFESTLANYRPYRADEPLEDWRAANAAVGRAGGHPGHGPPAPDDGAMHHGENGR